MSKKDGKKNSRHPSLYESFKLGERVVRTYKDGSGNSKEYRGLIMAISNDKMEIYWDTVDGKYRPVDMGVAFTTCEVNEVFKGNNRYTPIRKE